MKGIAQPQPDSAKLPIVSREAGTPFSQATVLLTQQEHIQLKWEAHYWKTHHARALKREAALKKALEQDRSRILTQLKPLAKIGKKGDITSLSGFGQEQLACVKTELVNIKAALTRLEASAIEKGRESISLIEAKLVLRKQVPLLREQSKRIMRVPVLYTRRSS